MPVEAKVVDTFFVSGVDDTSQYITVEYHYDGVFCSANKEVDSIYKYNVGSLVKIKCNPHKPAEIEDTYSYHGKIKFTVFLFIFDAILFSYVDKKGSKDEELRNLNKKSLEPDTNKKL